MATAFPDYRHFTARDYGSRLGVPRLIEALAKAGAHASFAMNAAWAERFPRLTAEIVAAGHEVIAHSTDMNGTIDSTLAEADERALIAASLDRLAAATGARPERLAVDRPLAVVEYAAPARRGGGRLLPRLGQ